MPHRQSGKPDGSLDAQPGNFHLITVRVVKMAIDLAQG